ncbi:hypothetical protein H4219_000463 [Mycoemilia scoparia]|uniref:JmjC domain-containing protein n=1 Tax=Mycoemilia scoparia TaxID=417184 RepID=A0A9W8DT17_9FUNG|nr:hypothetical protein H4219_000463 [Mycoemilia scoparia]
MARPKAKEDHEYTEKELTEMKGSRFVPCQRIKYSEYEDKDKVVEDARYYIEKLGVPVVISDIPVLNNPDIDENFFTLDWLCKNYSKQEVPVVSQSRIKQMWTWKKFKAMVDKNSDISKRVPKLFYAHDADCPPEWYDTVGKLIPDYYHYMGPSDLMRFLPKDLRADNLMIYIGYNRTKTPGHVDMCGTMGHNLMVNSVGNSTALWFIVARDDKQLAAKFWHQITNGKTNLESESYFMNVDKLRQTKFNIYVLEQKPGDFVLLPSDAVHQVINKGNGYNVKVSWNRTTCNNMPFTFNRMLPRLRKICRPEAYRCKATVQKSVIGYTEKILAAINEAAQTPSAISNLPKSLGALSIPDLLNDYGDIIRCLVDNLSNEWVSNTNEAVTLADAERMFSDESKDSIKDEVESIIMSKDETPYERFCGFCRCDIWNRRFHCPLCTEELMQVQNVDVASETNEKVKHVEKQQPEESVQDGGEISGKVAANTASEMHTDGDKVEVETGVQNVGTNAGNTSNQANETGTNDEADTHDGKVQQSSNNPENPAQQPSLPKEENDDGVDLCINCYSLGRTCQHPMSMGIFATHHISHIVHICAQAISAYRSMHETFLSEDEKGKVPVINPENIYLSGKPPISANVPKKIDAESAEKTLKEEKTDVLKDEEYMVSTMTAAHELWLERQTKIEDQCHYCDETAHVSEMIRCRNRRDSAEHFFCVKCMYLYYNENIFHQRRNRTWCCPMCKNDCPCDVCQPESPVMPSERDEATHPQHPLPAIWWCDSPCNRGSFIDEQRMVQFQIRSNTYGLRLKRKVNADETSESNDGESSRNQPKKLKEDQYAIESDCQGITAEELEKDLIQFLYKHSFTETLKCLGLDPEASAALKDPKSESVYAAIIRHFLYLELRDARTGSNVLKVYGDESVLKFGLGDSR